MTPWDPTDGGESQIYGPVFVPGPQIPAESWEPRYDTRLPHWDKPAVLAAAVPFLFFTFALPDLPVPELAWEPEYPALHQHWDPASETHASRAPFHFWHPETPAPPVDPAENPTWLPDYPDQVFRTPGLPILGGARGQLAAPFQSISTDLAQYPDSVLETKFPGVHAAEAPFFFKDPQDEPPVDLTPLGESPEYPDLLPSWQPVVEAARTPFLFYEPDPSTVDPTAERMGWSPAYPDVLFREEVRADRVPAFFFTLFENERDFAWRPSYPDFARADTVHASRVPAVFFVGEPSDVPATAEELGWAPTYPDFARAGSAFPADVPWLAFDPEPIPQFQPEERGRAFYPDVLFRDELLADRMPSVFFQGQDNERDLQWRPSYPDLHDPPQALAPHLHPAVFMQPEPVTAEEFFGFRGSYPDTIDRLELRHTYQSVFEPAFWPPTADVDLEWEPLYPDRVDPLDASVLTGNQRAFFFDPAPIAVPQDQLGWRPDYPDFARADQVHPSSVPYLAYETLPDTDELAWRPSYPDWLPLLQPQHPAYTSTVEPVTAEETFGFRPRLVDRPERAEVTADQAPWFFYETEPAVLPVPELSWQPVYPDAVDRLDIRHAMPAVFYVDALAELPVPDLSWAPAYPDFARAAPPSLEPSFFFELGSELVPFDPATLGWTPELPDFARVAPIAEFPATFEPDQWPPTVIPPALSWAPVYPDQARGLDVLAAHQDAFFAPEEPPAAFDPATQARAVYPDQVAVLSPHAGLAPFFFFDPRPVVPFDPAVFPAAFYPDVLFRVELLADQTPFFFTELIPIPTPPPPLKPPVTEHDCPPTEVPGSKPVDPFVLNHDNTP